MKRVRQKDTAPELLVRRFLHAAGLRYRLHRTDLPGKPDVVFPKLRTVVFVHGCFWHGHANCRRAALPKTRREFWREKMKYNAGRDERHQQELNTLGWRVLTVWECELSRAARGATMTNLLRQLTNWPTEETSDDSL